MSHRISKSRALFRWQLLFVVLAAPRSAVLADASTLATLSCARSSPEELAAAAEIASARANLAATSGLFAEGWTVGAAAGPRRVEGPEGRESDSDVAVEASVPLLAGGAARDVLAGALATAEKLLPEAARLGARSEHAGLFADAWAAERIEALRALSLAAADDGLATARRRAVEGADAPYQAELAAVERREAAIALAAAAAARRAAWGALAARCDLSADPQPLAPPAIPGIFDAAGARRRFASSAARRAIDARAELSRSALALETSRSRSRWLLRGEAAQEGDEDVARLGFAYRIPRAGENAALEARRASELARVDREAELAGAALAARLDAALALRSDVGAEASAATGSAASIASIRTALDALLAEGRSRLSEILPLRRQLLAAEIAEVERVAALAKASAEIELLTTEVQP